MTSQLYSKDAVGDLVLLEKIDENEINATLKRRHAKDLIYTYIGNVLLSVNPFKEIRGLYNESEIYKYRNRYIYENPPHIYALSEDTYRSLLSDHEDQCVIISGESGAGKTEASKKIMQYVSAVSGSGEDIERVKNQILKSNPMLEAFGNAKTIRNNNSSRFGKYMEIIFDFKGDPVGGRVTNYLLEKSRVVNPSANERSFHIFYQILEGISSSEHGKYHVKPADQFRSLAKSGSYKVDKMNDNEEFDLTTEGMAAMGMSDTLISEVLRTVMAVLWIGNIEFKGTDKATVEDPKVIDIIADLLHCDKKLLAQAFVNRTITAGDGKPIASPLSVEQARYTRDALAKTIYSRMFDFVVSQINHAIDTANIRNFKKSEITLIGVLDIYGFEIFDNNSFEQFCINFVNEKLQQIFIEKTLKSEQEEYQREGIQWTPIAYFNNKIVCDLIEKKPIGIMSFLDEECLLGKATDLTFLDKIEKNFSDHKHFERPKALGKPAEDFVIKHYAGDVKYYVSGFIDKNKDLVWRDLIVVGESSTMKMFTDSTMFPKGGADALGKARPVTAGTQFKGQVNALMETLSKCVPHYIRCIKPNDSKRAGLFEDDRVLHQVRYLGLLENVRVRRAGFAFRQTYDRFLIRYKMLSPETWPNWSGPARDGCKQILKSVKLIEGSQYQLGTTKVFIREPVSLFSLEELRERKLHDIVILIQKTYRSYKARKYFLEMREKSLGLFGRNKSRRRASIRRYFVGDYLNISDNMVIKKLMAKYGDKSVLFADEADKINKKYKLQRRCLLLTDKGLYVFQPAFLGFQGIYNLGQGKYKFNRRIEIKSIKKISLSKLADNYFVIHVNNEYDYVFIGERKTEFLTALADQYKELTSSTLALDFNNTINYQTKKKETRGLDFVSDEKQTSTSFFPNAKKDRLTVTVGKIDTVSEAYFAQVTPAKMTAGLAKPKRPGQAHMRGISIGNAAPLAAQNKGGNNKEVWARAIDDFKASDDRELSFNKGDIIRILEQEPNGWWSGDLNGQLGYVPSTYLEIVPAPARKVSGHEAPLPNGKKKW